MDADPSGGRVLAVGDDRLAVWSSLPSGRLSGSEKPAPVTADISCTVTGMLSALLLPGGGAEDYLVAGPSGRMRGPHQEPWRGSDPGAEALGTVAPDLGGIVDVARVDAEATSPVFFVLVGAEAVGSTIF